MSTVPASAARKQTCALSLLIREKISAATYMPPSRMTARSASIRFALSMPCLPPGPDHLRTVNESTMPSMSGDASSALAAFVQASN